MKKALSIILQLGLVVFTFWPIPAALTCGNSGSCGDIILLEFFVLPIGLTLMIIYSIAIRANKRKISTTATAIAAPKNLRAPLMLIVASLLVFIVLTLYNATGLNFYSSNGSVAFTLDILLSLLLYASIPIFLVGLITIIVRLFRRRNG